MEQSLEEVTTLPTLLETYAGHGYVHLERFQSK